MTPAPLAYTDAAGDEYDVWDLVDGKRRTLARVAAPARLCARTPDRTSTSPRVAAHRPDDAEMRSHLSLARERGLVHRQGDDAAAFAARLAADLAA